MGLCNRSKGEICAEEGESVSVVERRKRGGKGVYLRTAKEGVYLTIKVTTDSTGIFCGKEGWEEEDGSEL